MVTLQLLMHPTKQQSILLRNQLYQKYLVAPFGGKISCFQTSIAAGQIQREDTGVTESINNEEVQMMLLVLRLTLNFWELANLCPLSKVLKVELVFLRMLA